MTGPRRIGLDTAVELLGISHRDVIAHARSGALLHARRSGKYIFDVGAVRTFGNRLAGGLA